MAQTRRFQKLLRIASLLAIPYILVAVCVFLSQRRMLYFPSVQPLPAAVEAAKGLGFEVWTAPSGQFIGWKKVVVTNDPHPRVLIAHGNAGSALDRSDYAEALNQIEPCDVYILEYPGYGPRAGSPSQDRLFRAADEAIRLLETEGRVAVIGESLGTGVAAYLAGTHPKAVAALLLIAPYHNLGDVAQSHMQIFPAKLMLLDKFTSAEYLRSYHGPLAVLLAGQDTVVPKRFGQQLFDAYSGPKKIWEIQKAGHNDLPHAPATWWREVLAFWRS